jgi:hypothetical protein
VEVIVEHDQQLNGPHVTMDVLTAYSARGSTPCAMKICIIRCKYVEDSIGSTWAFYAPAQNFVNEISAPLRGLIM